MIHIVLAVMTLAALTAELSIGKTVTVSGVTEQNVLSDTQAAPAAPTA